MGGDVLVLLADGLTENVDLDVARSLGERPGVTEVCRAWASAFSRQTV